MKTFIHYAKVFGYLLIWIGTIGIGIPLGVTTFILTLIPESGMKWYERIVIAFGAGSLMYTIMRSYEMWLNKLCDEVADWKKNQVKETEAE